MKRYNWFIIIIFLFLFVLSQKFSVGQSSGDLPQIINYEAEEYKGHAQNWAIVMGQDGRMYFANNNGIIYFDSPKKIMGYNTSGALIEFGEPGNRTLIRDFSAWIDPDTDHIHLAFHTFRNYTLTGPGPYIPSGPYNYIYYAECENPAEYGTLSSWESYSSGFPLWETYYVVLLASVRSGGPPFDYDCFNYDPAIIGDYDGNVYVAFLNDTSNGNDENQTVTIRKRNAGASMSTWGSEVVIENQNGWADDISLDVDSKNRIYAAYSFTPSAGTSHWARMRRSSDGGSTWRNMSGAVGYEAPITQGALSSDPGGRPLR